MRYTTREGSLGATVDTWVNLATVGSETAPSAVEVPPGVSRIRQLLFSVGDEAVTAAQIGTNIILKLSGGLIGVPEQEFVVDGYSVIWLTAGAGGAPGRMYKREVDLPVKPGEKMLIDGCACGGVCAGSPSLGITIGWE